jgi:hypothetical protein
MNQNLAVSAIMAYKNNVRLTDELNNISYHSSIYDAYLAAFNAGRSTVTIEAQQDIYWEFVRFDKGINVNLLGSYGGAFEMPTGTSFSTLRGILAIKPWLNPSTGVITPGRLNVKHFKVRPQ